MAEEIIKNMEEINATGDSGKTVGIENLKVLDPTVSVGIVPYFMTSC